MNDALALIPTGLISLLLIAALAERLLPNPFETEDEDTP